MKHLLLTTIAAVVLVGCGESQQSAPSPESTPVEPIDGAGMLEPLVQKSPENPMSMGMMYAQTSKMTIHDAASDGNIESVKQLLAAGTDVNSISEIGLTPLHSATRFLDEIDIDKAKLIANRPGVINQDAGQFAQRYNRKPEIEVQIEIIKLLIDKGGDINASTRVGAIIEDGRTPLYNAAESLRIATVMLSPVMPEKCKEILNALGSTSSSLEWGSLKPGEKIPETNPIFPRIVE